MLLCVCAWVWLCFANIYHIQWAMVILLLVVDETQTKLKSEKLALFFLDQKSLPTVVNFSNVYRKLINKMFVGEVFVIHHILTQERINY